MMLLPGTLVDAVTHWRPGARPGKGGGEDQLQSKVHIHRKRGVGEFDAFSFALSYPENPLVCLDLQPRLHIFSIGNVCSISSGVLLLCMQIKQIRVW